MSRALSGRGLTRQNFDKGQQKPAKNKIEALSTDAELTSQIVVAEIDLCHRIAELANIGRKCQSCVSFKHNGAALDEFPAQKRNRNFA